MTQLSGNKISVIGAMSGTSLDGLDIAAVEFEIKNDKWSFKIVSATTIPYSTEWLKKLKNAPTFSGEELTELHSEYGNYTGKKIAKFIKATKFTPRIIASHGHTIFHRPEKHFTLQIGNGAEIAAVTKTTTVADFRTTDVAFGGQGAPLVPVGDKLLFNDFDYCLNLGGFANVSFEKEKRRIAFDICPVNFALNFFAEKQGVPYDKNGELGKKGNLNNKLLEDLNNLGFYSEKSPKSLGREWMEEIFFPVVNRYDIADFDKMRTIYEHIAMQITNTGSADKKMLITGGGAFNTYLIERIKAHSKLKIVIPDKSIIDYKEALIFALLGVLRIRNITNCYASVTGASKNSSSGIIFE